MSIREEKIIGIKVVNIMEENAEAIERMVNATIAEVHQKGLHIVEIQTTDDNIILVLGEK